MPRLIFILLLFVSNSFSQLLTTWNKTYGGYFRDEGNCIQQTFDGNFIIIGETESYGAGSSDFWLLKIDNNGDTLWTKTYGGVDDDVGLFIDQTSDSGYILTGWTYSYGKGLKDGWLIKTDKYGDTLWTRTYGGSDHDILRCVQETSDNGYILSGSSKSDSFAVHSSDAWLIKVDEFGDTEWMKTFYTDFAGDEFRSVKQTLDNGFICCGHTAFYDSMGLNSDVWLVKTNDIGDTLWTKTYGGNEESTGYSVVQTSDSGFVITGSTRSFGNGFYDIWVIRTNKFGDTLWTKTYNENSNFTSSGKSIIETSDYGYLLTGWKQNLNTTNTALFIFKLNSLGDTLWTEYYDGYSWDEGRFIIETQDMGFILTGSSASYTTHYWDLWVIKTDTNGMVLSTDFKPLILNRYFLNQNYPNPFNLSTKIKYTLTKTEKVKIEVFNLLGQRIETLLNKQMPAGSNEIEFTAKDLPSGVYLYRIETNNFKQTKKMILLK